MLINRVTLGLKSIVLRRWYHVYREVKAAYGMPTIKGVKYKCSEIVLNSLK